MKGYDFMNKKVKKIIISSVALISALGIATGVFFGIYPMKPDVKIMSAERRIKNNDTLLVASYNTASPWGSFIEGTYTTRRAHLFAQQINYYLPDVLGLQEMCFDWYNEINKNKSEYKFVAPLKTAFPQKMTAILYNSDTVELIDSGSITFSDCWNFKSRRAVWGVFRHIRTDKIFTVVNTHLSFIEESEAAQNFFVQTCQVNELYTTIQTLELQYPYPVFIIGDFNTKRRVSYQKSVINSGSYGILNSLYTDSEDIAKNKYYGENFNFNNTLNDHIFIKGEVTVKNLSLLSQDCFCTLSDHYPLFADIKL